MLGYLGFGFVLILILCLISLRVWQKCTNAVCLSTRRLEGRTCIVTGGTAGMGLEVAKDLARRGARVIVACPFLKEGIDAQETIIKETNNKNVEYKHLDLGSLKSAWDFGKDILEKEHRLDILVNNAGVGSYKNKTKDSLSFTMQVNYYGHFLLTLLLLPLLKKSGTAADKSRIVNVASLCHYFGRYQYGKMNNTGIFNIIPLYANSKICLILFAMELTNKLNGCNVVVNSVDPGAVGTRNLFAKNLGMVLGYLVTLLFGVFFKNAWEGAQTTIYAAVDESVDNVSGKFMKNCKVISPKASACNAEKASELWEESINLVLLKNATLNNIFQDTNKSEV